MFMLHQSASRRCAMVYSLILIYLCAPAVAATEKTQIKRMSKVTMAQAYDDFSWTREAWTGDDKPYQQARTEIEGQFIDAKNPELLLQNYKTDALKSPHDTLAQFRWACAAYTYASKKTVKDEVGFRILPSVILALASVPSPHTYDYDRLRFLIQSFAIVVPYQLKSIAERLLKKNPEDALVKYALAALLNNSNNSRDRVMAMVYAQQLVNKYPKDAKYYSLLAGFAYTTWFRSKTQTDANKAIAAYQRYLDIAGPDELFRENAQFYVKDIQQMQDHFNRGDKLPQ